MYIVERTRIKEDSVGQRIETCEYLSSGGWGGVWEPRLEQAEPFKNLKEAGERCLKLHLSLEDKKNVRMVKVKKVINYYLTYLTGDGDKQYVSLAEYQDQMLSQLLLSGVLDNEDSEEES